jgi:transposase
LVKLALSDENIKKDYENLHTIPGIASISAIAIIAEVPDIDILPMPELLLHMQDLIPNIHWYKGKSRISKIGSGNLRKILYFLAIISSSVNRNFQEFKQRMKGKRKHNMVIIVALMRKLLHIILKKNRHTISVSPLLFQLMPILY